MATAHRIVKYTFEDYRTAPPDRRYQLLDGELVMAPAPSLKHQRVQALLGALLVAFVESRGLGQVFPAPCDVVLSDVDVVQPDLLFVSAARAHLLSGGANVRGAPDLVVEIVSPSTADQDRGYKRSLYARHGVAEYWLIDPHEETLAVHRLAGGDLPLTRVYRRHQTLRSPMFKGLAIELKDIFS